MLLTALGRAYLAWCPAAERELILRTLAVSAQPDATLAKDRKMVDMLLDQVLRKGYGFREGGLSERTGSIAVPVRWTDRVIACVNMHYILSALSEREVADRYLEPLRFAAAEVERRMKAGGYLPSVTTEP
jgi:IclR family mhp operon transcriptional activator